MRSKRRRMRPYRHKARIARTQRAGSAETLPVSIAHNSTSVGQVRDSISSSSSEVIAVAVFFLQIRSFRCSARKSKPHDHARGIDGQLPCRCSCLQLTSEFQSAPPCEVQLANEWSILSDHSINFFPKFSILKSNIIRNGIQTGKIFVFTIAFYILLLH